MKTKRTEKDVSAAEVGRYRVDESSDHLLVRRTDRPDTAWRITTTELLGPRSEGSGLLVDFEALNGLERVGRLTLQWDPSFEAFRVNFVRKARTLSAQVFDVHAESAYVAIESADGRHTALVNPRTQEIHGFVPESVLSEMTQVARLFSEILEPVRRWVDREERVAGCRQDEGDDAPSVMFAPSKDQCKQDRKVGWVKAGLILAGAVAAAALTGGVGGLVVAGIGGASAGAEAADTENKHGSCQKEVEKEAEED